MSHYKHRNAEQFEPYYSQHVMAMTAEALHEKSDIAAELAARDAINADLLKALEDLVEWTEKSGCAATKPGGVPPFTWGATEYNVVTEARAAIKKARDHD